jgi:DNA-binding XRE family transcriptional regulator
VTQPSEPDTAFELGPLLRRLRDKQALSVQTCAESVGCTRQTWSNWEHGRTLPPPNMIRDNGGNGPVARVLEVKWQRLAKARDHDLAVRHRLRLLPGASVAAALVAVWILLPNMDLLSFLL